MTTKQMTQHEREHRAGATDVEGGDVGDVGDVADVADGADGAGDDANVDELDDLVPLVHLVLDRPAIAGNVGACVRLCAATGAALHVCGSELDAGDRAMWRAGLDYWPRARVHFHDSLARCLALLQVAPWIVEVGGTHTPWSAALTRGSVVIIGPEKGSVDDDVRARHPDRIITLPQRPGIRSLNMAQCAAVTVFEAVRQQSFAQTAPSTGT